MDRDRSGDPGPSSTEVQAYHSLDNDQDTVASTSSLGSESQGQTVPSSAIEERHSPVIAKEDNSVAVR